MPGGIFSHKDSLGKCEYPSHLYGQFHMSPSSVKKATPIHQTRDVLESSQQKVDREVELQFQSVGKSGVLFFIGQAGKYLFLVAVFPPYFVVYAIPKWMAQELIPKIIDEVENLWEKGIQLMIQLAVWGNKKMSPFSRFYGNMSAKRRKMVENIREFFQKRKKGVESGIKILREKAVDPIAGMIQKIPRSLSNFSFFSRNDIKQGMANGFKNFFAKLKTTVKNVASPLIFQNFASKTKELISNAFRFAKVENLKNKEKAEKIVQKWKEALQPHIEFVKQKLTDIQAKISQTFSQTIVQLTDYALPKIKRALGPIQDFSQVTKEKGQEALNKFVDLSRLAVQWGKINLSPAYQMTANMTQGFLQFFPRAVEWISSGKAIVNRFIEGLRKTVHYLTLKSLSLKYKLVLAAKGFYQFLKRFRDKGKQAFQQGKALAKILIKKSFRIALKGLEKGTIFIIRFILWIRIFLAWIRILTLYGLKLLPELTSRILKKLPQFSKR